MSAQMTYHRDQQGPVPAKWGVCTRCGRRAIVLTVNTYGKFCGKCSDALYREWQAKKPVPQEPHGDDDKFELRGD